MGNIRLDGLSALDPLAFLASLGTLLAVSEQCSQGDMPPPKLSFETEGEMVPTLTGEFSNQDELLAMLLADLDVLAGRSDVSRDAFLDFSYSDKSGKRTRDLKPPPEDFRTFAEKLVENASHENRRTVDWASSTLTDVAVDRGGNTKPFALHFTAGQQRFLTIAAELLDGTDAKKAAKQGRGVDIDDLKAAVFGPWPNNRELKVFNWSPAQERSYALRALDPSGDTKMGTPGADWLALRGLALLSSAPIQDRIVTGGVHGSWKNSTFSYPIWQSPLDIDATRSLLRHPAVRAHGDEENQKQNKGLTLPSGVKILNCRISRSEQGGYGSFSPPQPG